MTKQSVLNLLFVVLLGFGVSGLKLPVFAGTSDDIFPLGALGGKGKVPLGISQIEIVELLPNSPARRASIKERDIIRGVAGKHFGPAAENTSAAGNGPLEMLGEAIDEAEGRDGKLRIMLKQGNSDREVVVQLRVIGSFSKVFPFNCPKSQAYYDETCKYVADRIEGWGGVTGAVGGLALLSRKDSRYMAKVEKYAAGLIAAYANKTSLDGGGCSNWGYAYSGIFLCEYYWATKDSRALPAIKSLVNHLASAQAESGLFFHGKSECYGGNGLTVVGSAVGWFWAMAEKCGVDVPDDNWKRLVKYLHTAGGSSGDVAWIGYNHTTCDLGQSTGRTGNTVLSLAIADEESRWAEQLSNSLSTHANLALENHACATLGMIAAPPALYLVNRGGYRKYMDHWRWYFSLSHNPGGYADYIGSRGNIGGDSYLGYSNIMNAVVALALAAPQGNLYIYGKHLDIEGVSYFVLSPKLRDAYVEFMQRKYNPSTIFFLRTTASNSLASETDRAAADQMAKYFDQKIFATTLADIERIVDTGDLVIAQVRLREFQQKLGAFVAGNAAYNALAAKLNSPESKAILDLGAKYHALVAEIDRARARRGPIHEKLLPQLADRLRIEFAESATETPYKRLSRERLAALAEEEKNIQLLLAVKASQKTSKVTGPAPEEIAFWDTQLLWHLQRATAKGAKVAFDRYGFPVEVIAVDDRGRLKVVGGGQEVYLDSLKLTLKEKLTLAGGLAKSQDKTTTDLLRFYQSAIGDSPVK